MLDVLVIGGGNAALMAREAGASVLMLEASPREWRGGNSQHMPNLRCMHAAPQNVTQRSLGRHASTPAVDPKPSYKLPLSRRSPAGKRPCIFVLQMHAGLGERGGERHSEQRRTGRW